MRGIERRKWETRNSKHMVLGTCGDGVYRIEGRLGVSVCAVYIDTFVGREFRCIALFSAADF